MRLTPIVIYFMFFIGLVYAKGRPVQQTTTTTPRPELDPVPEDAILCPTSDVERGSLLNSQYATNLVSRQEWMARKWASEVTYCKVGDNSCSVPPKQYCYCVDPAINGCYTDPCTEGGCYEDTDIWEYENAHTITLHHTVSPRQSMSYQDSVSKVQSIQNYHLDSNGWCDIGYHFMVDSAGYIFQGRPFWDDQELELYVANQILTSWAEGPGLIQGAHSGDRCSNHNNIGVAIIGCYDDNRRNCGRGGPDNIVADYDGDITYSTLIDLLVYLCRQYSIDPTNIMMHKDFIGTECPGSIIESMVPTIRNDVLSRV